MSFAGERSLMMGTQIGKNISDPIQQYFQTKRENEEREKILGLQQAFQAQQQERGFQQQKEMNSSDLRNKLMIDAAMHPETGIVSGPQADASGVYSPQATDVTADEAGDTGNIKAQLLLKNALANQATRLGDTGFVIDPGARARGIETLKDLNAAKYGAMGRNLTVGTDADGNQVVINKATREAAPISVGNGQALNKGLTFKDATVLVGGTPHLIRTFPDGRTQDMGANKEEKGQVTYDANGQAQLVDNRLSPDSQPGQASPINSAQSDASQPPHMLTKYDPKNAPASVRAEINRLEPVKHFNQVAERADALPGLLEQAQKSGNYTIADSAINEELQRLISNQAIRGSAMGLMYKGQPLADKVQGFFQQFAQGGNQYSPATRQEAIEIGQTLYNIAKQQRDNAVNGYRDSYPNKEMFDSQIAPTFNGYSAPNSNGGAVQSGKKIGRFMMH